MFSRVFLLALTFVGFLAISGAALAQPGVGLVSQVIGTYEPGASDPDSAGPLIGPCAAPANGVRFPFPPAKVEAQGEYTEIEGVCNDVTGPACGGRFTVFQETCSYFDATSFGVGVQQFTEIGRFEISLDGSVIVSGSVHVHDRCPGLVEGNGTACNNISEGVQEDTTPFKFGGKTFNPRKATFTCNVVGDSGNFGTFGFQSSCAAAAKVTGAR